jgi:hypothetical protein
VAYTIFGTVAFVPDWRTVSRRFSVQDLCSEVQAVNR